MSKLKEAVLDETMSTRSLNQTDTISQMLNGIFVLAQIIHTRVTYGEQYLPRSVSSVSLTTYVWRRVDGT